MYTWFHVQKQGTYTSAHLVTHLQYTHAQTHTQTCEKSYVQKHTLLRFFLACLVSYILTHVHEKNIQKAYQTPTRDGHTHTCMHTCVHMDIQINDVTLSEKEFINKFRRLSNWGLFEQ